VFEKKSSNSDIFTAVLRVYVAPMCGDFVAGEDELDTCPMIR